MKKLIILVSFLLLASPAMAFESGVEASLPDGVESLEDSETRVGSATVVSITWPDNNPETTILFANGAWIKGWGSLADIFATIGSESLANNINISQVWDDAGEFIGAKLQH